MLPHPRVLGVSASRPPADETAPDAFNVFIVYNEGGGEMSQLTVRNVPPEVVTALRVRAARLGRSAEAEHREILAAALRGEAGDFWARADALRGSSRRQRSDSAAILREMRDAR
jgi:plasmid stability protein